MGRLNDSEFQRGLKSPLFDAIQLSLRFEVGQLMDSDLDFTLPEADFSHEVGSVTTRAYVVLSAFCQGMHHYLLRVGGDH